MKKALLAILLADISITSQVADRIYWKVRTQGTALPALVLNIVGQTLVHNFDGAGDVSTTRVQIDAYARRNGPLDALAEAVKTALAGKRFTQNNVEIQGVFYRNGRDLTEEGLSEADRIDRFLLEFEVHHRKV